MFEKLFSKLKKQTSPKEEVSTPVIQQTQEDIEIEEERKNAEAMKKQIAGLDPKIVAIIEKDIRNEFADFDADPSDLNECFDQLDDIRDSLESELYLHYQTPVLKSLAIDIIYKVFEEKIISLGSTMDAFREWEANEELSDEFISDDQDEENIDEESIENGRTR